MRMAEAYWIWRVRGEMLTGPTERAAQKGRTVSARQRVPSSRQTT
jgi:hypothetical protein